MPAHPIQSLVFCLSGEEVTTVICRDTKTGGQLQDSACRASTEPPAPLRRTCHRPDCQPEWISDGWSSCSRSCGGGRAWRAIYCVEELGDGSFQRTHDRLCHAKDRPETDRSCNEFECPLWFAGEWSPVSGYPCLHLELNGVEWCP